MADDGRTYIRLHDGMPDHPKVDALSDRAFRLLVETWCWCSRHLTDGRVPRATWNRRGTPASRRELVTAGLVEDHGTEGVRMHDYLEHQRSRSEVEELSAARRAAQQSASVKGNHKRWHVGPDGRPSPDCPLCQKGSQPDPQPDPPRDPQGIGSGTPSGSLIDIDRDRERETTQVDQSGPSSERANDPGARDPGRPIPVGWAPHAGHVRTAKHRRLNLEHEAAQFAAHAQANNRFAADWDAAFTVWLGNARPTGPNPWLRTSNGTDANIAALIAAGDDQPRAIGGGQ